MNKGLGGKERSAISKEGREGGGKGVDQILERQRKGTAAKNGKEICFPEAETGRDGKIQRQREVSDIGRQRGLGRKISAALQGEPKREGVREKRLLQD